METALEELLINKDFSALSEEEKQLVLSEMTPLEYSKMRTFLINSKTIFIQDFENLNINPSIKTKLLSTFKQQRKKQTTKVFYVTIFEHFKTPPLRPILYLSAVTLAITFTFHSINKKSETLVQDIENVSTYLNQNKESMKINKTHSSSLIDGNMSQRDSIAKINEYLEINTESLNI